ncbi:MAG: hypothetical protein LBI15_11410, partial [Dysgonamonadaceae bacterium]|nr:hypothetical protein [Dysgonamonadaceae bacterium]
ISHKDTKKTAGKYEKMKNIRVFCYLCRVVQQARAVSRKRRREVWTLKVVQKCRRFAKPPWRHDLKRKCSPTMK